MNHSKTVKEYLTEMIKVTGCSYTPSGNKEDDELSYLSFTLVFPEGFQLFTEGDNVLTATINCGE